MLPDWRYQGSHWRFRRGGSLRVHRQWPRDRVCAQLQALRRSAIRRFCLNAVDSGSQRPASVDSALSFIDNHDSQRSAHALNANTSAQMLHPQGARGITATLAAPSRVCLPRRVARRDCGGILLHGIRRVRLMSSYYFDDHDQGLPATPVWGLRLRAPFMRRWSSVGVRAPLGRHRRHGALASRRWRRQSHASS